MQEAWSDTATAVNWQVLPTQANEISRATVEDNQTILLEWERFETGIASILIERLIDAPGENWQTVANVPGSDLKFIDRDVDIMEISYAYRVSARDSCGNFSPRSNLGKSILLKVEQSLGVNTLDWTAYIEWPFDVDIYEIEVYDESVGAWTLVDVVQGTITRFEDRLTNLNQGTLCYRVRGHELGGDGSVSLSNEVCVPIFPEIHAPNAFTPNQDGVNDEFFLKGIYVESFNLVIFDRWGLKVFETTDINTGWNGSKDGKPVPEGVYVFVAEGVGVNGTPFQIKGSVTLIR